MPYSTSSELPQSVRNAIPSANGKEMFRNVVNNQLKAGKSESVAFASAWAALQRAGYNKKDGQWIRKASGAIPIYGFRPVLNAEEIVAWAQENGITPTLQPDDMHVTVVYSKTPFMADTQVEYNEPAWLWGDRRIVRGGNRTIARLGKEGEALVLKIESLDLLDEWLWHRKAGASWDYETYQPHITLSYSSDVSTDFEAFDGDIILGPLTYRPIDPNWSNGVVEKSEPTTDGVHVPSTDWKRKPKQVGKAEGYLPPQAARNNAKRAIAWKEEHGDAVKGGTQVGWTRAHQLSSGERLSLSTVKRMAQFNRHRKNAVVAPEYKSEPWKDAGHVAWLLWGGTTGVDWAKGIAERVQKRQVTDDLFTDKLGAMARSVDIGLDGEVHVVIVDGQLYYRPGDDEEDYVEALWDGPEEEEETDDDESNGDLLDTAIRAILGAVMEKSSDISSSVNIIKADDEQRIVWGWASVATENGEPVFDIHGDHIPMEELTKASVDFMRNYRVGKTEHFGKQTSEVIAMLPLSKSLAEALGIQTNREGLVVGFKVHDDETWNGIKSGDLPAFSIGGRGELHAAE